MARSTTPRTTKAPAAAKPAASASKAAAAKAPAPSKTANAERVRKAPLDTPSRISSDGTRDISAGLTLLLADFFALYLKTKNFHWHMSGTHFRDYHLMLDEQAAQIYDATDDIAERARKIGGSTLKSLGQAAKMTRVLDNDADFVGPDDMLAELRGDNLELAAHMASLHNVADEYGDVATTSFLEVWIDEAERRAWFLFEAGRRQV